MIALRTEIRDMKGECAKLEQLPATQGSDALRIVVPRTITTLYTLRNKRSGGHTAAEVDPSRADSLLTERIADWLMAELFRLGHQMPLDQAEGVIEALVDRRLPVVFRAGDYRRVLRRDLAPKDEILVLLYGEANGATVAEIGEWSRIPRTSLDRYVRQLDGARLVRVEQQGRTRRVFLLPTGERHVESERLLDPEPPSR